MPVGEAEDSYGRGASEGVAAETRPGMNVRAEPPRERGEAGAQNHAGVGQVRGRDVEERQEQEMPRPVRAEEVELRLRVADGGADEERAEEEDVVADDGTRRAGVPAGRSGAV